MDVDVSSITKAACELVAWAARLGVTVRIFGSCAVVIKCQTRTDLLRLNNRVPKDVDVVVGTAERTILRRNLIQHCWNEDIALTALTDGCRMRFVGRSNVVLDVAAGQLRFNQTLDLERRLNLDSPTISTADLLLSKLQINEPTLEDYVDLFALLTVFELGEEEDKTISKRRIDTTCSNSWRWYHAADLRLSEIADGLCTKRIRISDEQAMVGAERAEAIRQLIRQSRKSIWWKLRRVVGDRLESIDRVETA